MFKHRLMLSAAATALFAGPALAANPTIITTILTAPVKTSTANTTTTPPSPDNVQINSGGGITINATGAALTIDSNNWVNSGGTISNKNTTGARGVVIDATGGTLTAPGNPFLLNTGTIDLSGSGTGKVAILLNSGTYNGAITLTSPSVVTVNGDASSAILFSPSSVFIGDLTVGGTVTVSQTTLSGLTPSNVTAINLGGTLTGNVILNGTVGAAGAGAEGLVLLNGSSVSGVINNQGTLASIGIATASTKQSNPEAGSALLVNGSVGGGILNAGPNTTGSAIGSGTINMRGVGTAIAIGNANTAAITIGKVTAANDSVNGDTYGFINHGTITAAPQDTNQSSSVAAIQIGGGSATTTILGGLLNSGTIAASSTSANNGVSTLSSGLATGIVVGANSSVPLIVNTSYGSGGTISASVTGPGGGVATAIFISNGANSGGSMEIDNLNGAGIVAQAGVTDASFSGLLSAEAIKDLSNTLTTIKNSGLIQANASVLTNGLQNAIAIDALNNTVGLTVLDGVGSLTGTIQGNVLFGSGSDDLEIVGNGIAFSTVAGDVHFGTATAGFDTLHIGGNGVLGQNTGTAIIGHVLQSTDGHLNVVVDNTGILSINNTKLATGNSFSCASATCVNNLHISSGGRLDLAISQNLATGLVKTTTGTIALDSGALFNVNFGSFVTNTSTSNPIVLLDTPFGALTIPDAAAYATTFANSQHFLYTGSLCTHNVAAFFGTSTDCGAAFTSADSQLLLTLALKSAATLGLTGYAATPIPGLGSGTNTFYDLVNQILPTDNTLGAAVVGGVTTAALAQSTYDAFAPQVTGGSRAIAVAITDQSSGPVGARQRALRMYGKQPGESSLWGIEYAEFLKDPGENLSGGGLKPGFKDHGFGFALGADGGSAADGWYGGALTFYTGDIGEVGDRHGQTQSEWYMLTGYTDWRGRGLFFDSNLNVGVAQFKGKRILELPSLTRTATNRHVGVYLSGGFTTGAMLKYGGTTIAPQLSVDALTMRENGYTESGGGSGTTGQDGFDLVVGPSYTNSLRSFLGLDLRQDIDLGDFFLQPEARGGYRYDFLANGQKVNANFVALPGTTFSMTGPDPANGNFVAGASLSASTDTWSLGVSYDWIRGSNGATQQAGQFTLVGRI